MSQYRKTKVVSTGAAITLKYGFIPSHVIVTNYTNAIADANSTFRAEWFKDVSANASAILWKKTVTTKAVTEDYTATNGITPVSLGGDWQNTIYTLTGAGISAATPAVVTVSTVTPTNGMTLVNGMTFTMSGVVGVTNVNQQRFVVAGLSGTTFNLYDTFGNPVTANGTYVSGGQMDVISYPPTAPVLDSVTGQVVTPGSPAGLQQDIGYYGITLGSEVYGSNNDVLVIEAFSETPTGW